MGGTMRTDRVVRENSGLVARDFRTHGMVSPMNTTSADSAKAWRIAMFAGTVVLGGVLAYLVYQRTHRERAEIQEGVAGGPTAEAVARLAPADLRRVLEVKDIAIGHLENGPAEVEVGGKKISGLDVAADGFAALARDVPRETLPLQNLAVARLLLLQNAQNDIAPRREQARTAVGQLLKSAPDFGPAYWVAAAIELFPDPTNPSGIEDLDRQKAITWLQRATELEPHNAIFWFALSRAATKPRDVLPSEISRTALGKAYAASPRNIFLLTEWLSMQAKVKDPSIEQTLVAAQSVLGPLSTAAKRPGQDLSTFLNDAIAALKKGEWQNVSSKVRLIQNVVRPEEVSKSDITRVDVHPLEFVQYDFSPAFQQANPSPEPAWKSDTPVRLTVGTTGLPPMAGIIDLRVVDVDLNGLPDLIVLQEGKVTVFGRDKADDAWVEKASLAVPAGMRQILATDLDRDRRKSPSSPAAEATGGEAKFDRVLTESATCFDADPDLIVCGQAGVLVFQNMSEAADSAALFVPVPNDELAQLTDVATALVVDIEHDGDLDLVLSSAQGLTIWEAGAKMTYRNISANSMLPPAAPTLTAMLAVDWERDVDIDVVLAEPTGAIVGILENQRHGEFRWQPFSAEYQALQQPTALALVEADGNVSWDLVSAGAKGVHVTLTATPRAGSVKYLRTVAVSEKPQRGALVWDFDNDGFRDIAAWGETGLQVLRGGPQVKFQQVELVDAASAAAVRHARCADVDRDGDQDLVVVTADGLQVLVNQGGTGNNWLTLYPMGQEDNKGRCNHDAVGSLVELRAGGWYQAQVVESPTVHFGLGDRTVAEQVRIVWTNGVPQDIVELKGNVAICERMALKGSCPYIYTLADGKFSFFTDCLWAAPLGLVNAEGQVAPSRSWEYLSIPGDRLTPHEGSYWLQFTEELWEAGYFDQVQLIAVDHPADVEIFTNEKVGPPSISEFKVHTVRQRRKPRSAVDQKGRDLLPLLDAADGQFVKGFEQRIRQGLVSEHYLELDLGLREKPERLTLFLTGWIYPTDTSLNVAFAQDPETAGPRMPSVWVPDETGTWRETIAFMGFPGGKTKTIAIDLSQAFLAHDYRVRIPTTAEIYWDEVFFAVDEAEVEIRQTPLKLTSADLAYRGFSRRLPVAENAPQMYDAAVVDRAPQWPPMRGQFTRFGRVRELLLDADDMLVVLGAGDAITARFEVPTEPVPAGWKRDFILHSVGWDKDADLNTVYGQTVDPLPFRGMRSYPFEPDEPIPSSDIYLDYLRRYQTREQNAAEFWRKLHPVPIGAEAS